MVFPHEPVLQVEGPLIEAQLLETVVLNTLNFQTLIATKAARTRLACGDDDLVEFGLRRAQGPDGGLSGSTGGLHRRGGQHLQRAGRQGVRDTGEGALTPTPG